jgi:hypothetical protein
VIYCACAMLLESLSCCSYNHAASAVSVVPWQSFNWRWSMGVFFLVCFRCEYRVQMELFHSQKILTLPPRVKYARSFILSIILHFLNSGYFSAVRILFLAFVLIVEWQFRNWRPEIIYYFSFVGVASVTVARTLSGGNFEDAAVAMDEFWCSNKFVHQKEFYYKNYFKKYFHTSLSWDFLCMGHIYLKMYVYNATTHF